MRRTRQSQIVVAAVVALAVCAAGTATLLVSKAATSFVTAEAEIGTLQAGAVKVQDADASGASAVAFRQAGSAAVKVVLTTGAQTKLLAAEPQLNFTSTGTPATANILEISSEKLQTIDGFGAAMTDSSASVISSLSETKRKALMTILFSRSQGAGISSLRVPMGASDFARSSYTYNDLAAGKTDPSLAGFSIAHDEAQIIPLLQEAKRINPSLKLIATTWSAPAWMKTTGSLNKGTLKTDMYKPFADYYVKFLQAYAAKGLKIDMIAPQNEPQHQTSSYPTMTFTAAQEADFIGNYLAPALRSAKLDTKIYGYDHNWDTIAYPTTLLNDPAAGPAITGTMWHCYGGQANAQTDLNTAFPAKKTYMSECSGGDWSPDFTGNMNWTMENLLVGGMRRWSGGAQFWNLALNTTNGPTNGGCSNCRGVVTVDTAKDTVAAYNVEYYMLAHMGVMQPGAVRLNTNTLTRLKTAVVQNADGSYALVANNASTSAVKFAVRLPDASWFEYAMPASSVASFTWEGK